MALPTLPSPQQVQYARQTLQDVGGNAVQGISVGDDKQIWERFRSLTTQGGLPESALLRLPLSQQKATKDLAKMVNDQSKQIQDIKDISGPTSAIESQPAGVTLGTKIFNLKKYAQTAQDYHEMFQSNPEDPFMSDPGGLEQEQQLNEGSMLEEQEALPSQTDQTLSWDSPEDLGSFLAQYPGPNELSDAVPELVEALLSNESAKDALKAWYETGNEERRSTLQQMIYHGLPEGMRNKQPGDIGGQNVPVQEKPFGDIITSYLAKVDGEIQKAAKQIVSKNIGKTFNLKKIAQHQSVHQNIMWGPSQVRPDPFLRGQPVSDWHILERNKGWGQDIDGYWGVDWETVWRQNIMDKYSRPYRDTKTGRWVGGYIEKRFEVDKNIPEANNMQLLPGERRRPILPEYGSTEARLQSMRNKNDEKLGRVFNNTEKPFNWREANGTAKIVKEAQDNALLSRFQTRPKDPVETTDPIFPNDAEADLKSDESLSDLLNTPREELGRWEGEFEDSMTPEPEISNPLQKARKLLQRGVHPGEVEDADTANAMRLILSTQPKGEESATPLPQIAASTKVAQETSNGKDDKKSSSAKKKMTQSIRR